MSDGRFGYTIVYVPEVQAALDFYTRAFGFEQRFISPDSSYGELVLERRRSRSGRSLGDAHFLTDFCGIRWQSPPFGTELALHTGCGRHCRGAIVLGASPGSCPKRRLGLER